MAGNCLNINGEKEKAQELYLEAIGVEADCVEAIYNLGECLRVVLGCPSSIPVTALRRSGCFGVWHTRITLSCAFLPWCWWVHDMCTGLRAQGW